MTLAIPHSVFRFLASLFLILGLSHGFVSESLSAEAKNSADGSASPAPTPASISAEARIARAGSAEARIARAGYERFKSLAGDWRGKSTRGWDEMTRFEVMAGGSTVMEISDFAAHPGQKMATMFHLDGDRLMLTHYCVAGNQPRLEATSFEDGGRTVIFTFRDATNLASRDEGHMDKAVFQFLDDDRYTTRWTFYRDGKEDWMEEIEMQRMR